MPASALQGTPSGRRDERSGAPACLPACQDRKDRTGPDSRSQELGRECCFAFAFALASLFCSLSSFPGSVLSVLVLVLVLVLASFARVLPLCRAWDVCFSFLRILQTPSSIFSYPLLLPFSQLSPLCPPAPLSFPFVSSLFSSSICFLLLADER